MATVFRGLVLALVLIISACASSGGEGAAVAADCASQIRLGDVVYTSHGYSDHDATRYGAVDTAECHDVGRNAPGSVFLEDPRQVTAWTFEAYPPEQVLGVRFEDDTFAVFVADSVPRDERDRIYRDLRAR